MYEHNVILFILQIALDRHGSEDTRILYCTTGILKEKLIARKNMHEFTHIMLDEVRHEFNSILL